MYILQNFDDRKATRFLNVQKRENSGLNWLLYFRFLSSNSTYSAGLGLIPCLLINNCSARSLSLLSRFNRSARSSSMVLGLLTLLVDEQGCSLDDLLSSSLECFLSFFDLWCLRFEESFSLRWALTERKGS